MDIILSLYPGAGLMDTGFSQAGFSVVRGPDLLLGQDIRSFHIPPGIFTGIIGGPPCQDFSRARRRPPTGYGLEMLDHFRRLVTEGKPLWWLAENVPAVPDIHIPPYTVQRFNLFASEFGLKQKRNRAIQFGSLDGVPLTIPRVAPSHTTLKPAALAHDGRSNFAELCRLQGLPPGYDLPGLSRTAKIRAVGNGVPVPVAEAIARAIIQRHALQDARVCICGCGRTLTGKSQQQAATPACRKRLERSRKEAGAAARGIV